MLHYFSRFRKLAALATAWALIAQPALAIQTAGTVFVNVDATTFNTGNATWTNSGSYGNFTAAGTPKRISIADTPGVYLNGLTDYFTGPDLAPDGLVGDNPTRTIEAWVFNPSIASEETIVSWGKRGGGLGTNMAFNYGNHELYGAVGHWGGGEQDLGWIGNPQDGEAVVGAPEANKWHHLVYTYDGEVTRVYSDGELMNDEATLEGVDGVWGGLNTHPDTAIAIGTQWEADAVTPTGALRGSMAISRLRIHDGVLSDSQILSNFNEEKSAFKNPIIGPPSPEKIPNGPKHRYSFSNAAANDATNGVLIDSVGGANGVVLGSGSSFTGTQLRLDGGDSASAAYGDLPNGLISSLTDVTVESWVTIEGVQNWHRLFDFGSNNPGGEDGELTGPGDDNGGSTEGQDYLAFTASRGTGANDHRVELRDADGGPGNNTTTIDFSIPKNLPDEPYSGHFTLVYDHDGDTFGGSPLVTIYKDGVKVAEGATTVKLSDINDVNNWLGRSNWTNDANFQGTFDEFRIYDYALSNNQVLGNFQAGPNTVNLATILSKCDFDADGDCDAVDIDALNAKLRAGSNEAKYDVNGDGSVNSADRDRWVQVEKKTYYGDINLDGEFNTTDLVLAFTVGEYEDTIVGNSGWADGDFDGDAEFSTSDLVVAFSDGGFEAGPRAATAAVPEPATLSLAALGLLGLLQRRRRR